MKMHTIFHFSCTTQLPLTVKYFSKMHMLKTLKVVLFHIALTKKNFMYNFTPNTKDTVNVQNICSYLVTIR